MKICKTFPVSKLATYTKITGYIQCFLGMAPYLLKVKNLSAFIVSKDSFVTIAFPSAHYRCVSLSKAELTHYKKTGVLIDISGLIEMEVNEIKTILVPATYYDHPRNTSNKS